MSSDTLGACEVEASVRLPERCFYRVSSPLSGSTTLAADVMQILPDGSLIALKANGHVVAGFPKGGWDIFFLCDANGRSIVHF